MRSSVIECAANHAAVHPEKTCLADAAGSMSYAELWLRVRACAARLAELGLGRGRCVLIECDQSADYVAGVLGIQLAGGVAVPLERNMAAARLAEIAHETDAMLLASRRAPDGLDEIPLAFADVVALCEVPDAGVSSDFDLPASDAVCEILFSTGTTGKSKGIVMTHRANIALAENVICGVEMKPGNVEIVPMPLSHSHGLRRTYSSLVNGSTTVLAQGVLALKKMFNLMDEYRVTSMDISPSMLSIMFKLSGDRLGDYADALDYVQLGSAPLAESDKERIARLLPHTRLYNFYGSTESGCSCLFEFGKAPNKPGCVGLPCVNARFVVVDADRNPIESSPDSLGFIASAGDMNMECYLNAPELTKAAMGDGFVYTKDLGYIDDEGYVFMVGRKDDVINFGGVKIAPEEVESAVAESPIVADCACVPVPDELCGQMPVLCIVLEDGASYDARSFKAFLSGALDANKQPGRVVVLDEIPRTFNGKIRRNLLVEQLGKDSSNA